MPASVSPSQSPSNSPSKSPSASPSTAAADLDLMREYGYRVTGDTGRVAVTNKNIKVKSFILTGAALSSATITNKDGDNIIVITQDTDIAGGTVQVYWEQRINGLNVQLSAYAAVLNVIVE